MHTFPSQYEPHASNNWWVKKNTASDICWKYHLCFSDAGRYADCVTGSSFRPKQLKSLKCFC